MVKSADELGFHYVSLAAKASFKNLIENEIYEING